VWDGGVGGYAAAEICSVVGGCWVVWAAVTGGTTEFGVTAAKGRSSAPEFCECSSDAAGGTTKEGE
jgi:hypothetical protein